MIRLARCCLLAGCGVTTRASVMLPNPSGSVDVVFDEYEQGLQLDPKSSRFGERASFTGPRFRLRWQPDGGTIWLGRDFGYSDWVRGQVRATLPPAPPGGTSLATDTTTGAQEVRTLDPPFLLGADTAGFLWLTPVDRVEAGTPWPVVRWHPETGNRTHLSLPTRP